MAPNQQDPAGLRRLLHAMGYPRTAEFGVDGACVRAGGVVWMWPRVASCLGILTNDTVPTPPPTHHPPTTTKDAGELCKCVAWLEDRKVRLYDIDQRAPLRAPGEGWDAAFQQVRWGLVCCGWLVGGAFGRSTD